MGKVCGTSKRYILPWGRCAHVIFAFTQQLFLSQFVYPQSLADTRQQMTLEAGDNRRNVVDRRLRKVSTLANNHHNKRTLCIYSRPLPSSLIWYIRRNPPFVVLGESVTFLAVPTTKHKTPGFSTKETTAILKAASSSSRSIANKLSGRCGFSDPSSGSGPGWKKGSTMRMTEAQRPDSAFGRPNSSTGSSSRDTSGFSPEDC